MVRQYFLGLESSTITNDTSNADHQFTTDAQQPSTSSKAASKLVMDLEGVHTQLKKTLLESRKIISGEGIELPKPPASARQKDKSPSPNASNDTTNSVTVEEEEEEDEEPEKEKSAAATTGKPKIINSERVNIKLNRYRLGQRGVVTTTDTTTTTTTGTGTGSSAPEHSEDAAVIASLQNEILEQSKSQNKSVPVDSLKDSDDSLLKSSQAPVKDSGELSKNDASNDENNQSVILDVSSAAGKFIIIISRQYTYLRLWILILGKIFLFVCCQ